MILLVNGPNLNLLGEREPELYGRETLGDVERLVREACAAHGVEVLAFQSNWEGALLDFLQAHRREAEGVILNPGGLTHTSRALHDCLRALPCPIIEVHVSNIHAREAWRGESVVAPAVTGQVVGLGVAGYRYAALELCARVGSRPQAQPEGKAEPWQATSLAQPVVAATPAPPPPPAAKEPATSSVEPAAPAERHATAEHLAQGIDSPFALPAPGSGEVAPGDEDVGEDEFAFTESRERGEYEPL